MLLKIGSRLTIVRLCRSAVSKLQYLWYNRSDFGSAGATSVQPEELLRFNQVLVDGGHVMQGQGCSERNLTSLVRHVMALPRFDVVVDFLLRAFKMRRDSRRNQLPYQ